MNRTVHFFATYYEQKDTAITLVQSLLRQTEGNWKLTICSNGDKSILDFETSYGFMWEGDDRITIKLLEEDTGHWGALNRKSFIQEELGDDELVVNTSVEDYYVPKTIEYINKRDESFIMWDFTHHHFEYNLSHCISQPRLKKIDWGNYALLGSIAKTVDMESVPTGKRDDNNKDIMENAWESFYGDGYFVEFLFRQHPTISNIRLPKVLFAKN